MGSVRMRRGLGALELSMALALLAAILVHLPGSRPRPRREDSGAEADALVRRLERLLATISRAEHVLEPRPTAARPVSRSVARILLAYPDGTRGSLEADSFQVRRRAPGVYLVRVRLVGTETALFSAAQIGARCPEGTP